MNFKTTAATALLCLSVSISISSFSPALAAEATLSPAEIKRLLVEGCTADRKLFITYEEFEALSGIGLNVSYNFPNGGGRNYALLRCSEGRFIRNYTRLFNSALAKCLAGNLENNKFFIPAENVWQWGDITGASIGSGATVIEFFPATDAQKKMYLKVFGYEAQYRGATFTCTPTLNNK